MIIDDFAEFDADCAVRLRMRDAWARRPDPASGDSEHRRFDEFMAAHPLVAERVLVRSSEGSGQTNGA